MSVDYNNFSNTFSNSRINMKWEEIDYFIKYLKDNIKDKKVDILDVGCGNGRLLEHLNKQDIGEFDYLGLDSSVGLIDEAKKIHTDNEFKVLNMLNLEQLKREINYLFFIASFHHLESIEDRLKVLIQAKKLLKPNGTIFMTNWALESNLNLEKYKDSLINNSTNQYQSKDFKIKIGRFDRFYHSFSIEELDYLFKEAGLEIIENKLFSNQKNIVSIVR
ncbi:MAG: class I SAM-dependent methyltransferase [Candidatus Gracilibacteria bacterium]|nr:class I SAM-dependent methyltransferase [Candidatus Gracilibacteria bacterium]